MSSSVHLILKHLDLSQQQVLVDDLVSTLRNDDDYANHSSHIDTFCEIVNHSSELSEKYLDFAYDYSVRILKIEASEPFFESILKLSSKLENLSSMILSYITGDLKTYMSTYPRHFNGVIINETSLDLSGVKDYELSNAYILNLLKFIEWYFIHDESLSSQYLNSELDKLCYIYVTNEELGISKAASKVLKWRMPSVCQSVETTSFLWRIIFSLQESNDNTQISYGYTIWLRFFGHQTPENLKFDAEFQKIVSNEKYWYYLRDGLISLTHEHKKFALTLVQMSIRALNTNLSCAIIRWDCSKEEEYTDSWKRFCTLYEILGIDSAMNQAVAATNDLLNVFSPGSYIPVPFALTILSVGFRASQDRIKKFALKLTFSLPTESLSLFKNDFKFISHVFLPFTMKSSHFSVQNTSNGHYTSPFAETMCEFISRCVISLNSPDEITHLVTSIFEVLSEMRLTFGIARIYIAWGVLKGLEKKGQKPLKGTVLQALLPLFETIAEGDICRTAIQTIHLKMLLHVDPSSTTLESYVGALTYFVQVCGYQVYADNQEFFIDYFDANFQKEEFASLIAPDHSPSVEEFLIVSSYILSNKIEIPIIPPILSHPQCYNLLIQMPASGLSFNSIWSDPLIVSRVGKLIKEMVEGSTELPIAIYNDCAMLLNNRMLFSDEFWASVDLNPIFENVIQSLISVDNLEEALYFISQLKFLTVCLKKCVYNEGFNITQEDLTKLLNNALKNIPKGSDPTFYKAKDELISYILDNVKELMKVTVFSKEIIQKLLKLTNDVISMSECNSHLANVGLMSEMLQRFSDKNPIPVDEAKSIASNLKLIWDDIIRDRLVLNQRSLHQAFIGLVLDEKLLLASAKYEELADSLFEILDELISNAAGRKGLLPCLFRGISSYQILHPDDFENTLWLAKVIVKGAFLFQSELNIFQLDCIVSEGYDKYLNISGESLYKSVYGDPEISYRATIFAIAGSLKTHRFAHQIWEYVFDNEKIFHFINPKKRTDREEQWKRIQFLSLFVATADVLSSMELVYYCETFLLPRLFKEASPLCRTYIEWILSLTILRCPDFRSTVFNALKEGVEAQQPLVVVTFERVSMLVSMQLPPEEKGKFLSEFAVDVIIPMATSNRALNRHFSASMVRVLCNEMAKGNVKLSTLVSDALQKVDNISNVSLENVTYRAGDALLWDIRKDLNLVAVTGGILLRTSDREVDCISENDYKMYLSEKQKSMLRIPIGHDEHELWVKGERSGEVRVESFYVELNETDESSMLQTKSGVWSTVMEIDESSRAAAQVKRSPLIVVSSLVDKPPNLGGICRLCDCLGAGWMTVDDISVKNDSEFKSVAVTADRWMPLIEVKIPEIAEFMKMKKKEGYTLIGLEQTDKSVELNGDLKFPEKSLILLGKEREGIPGDLLAELDMCVIIKQVGIVRSMNIQTATAVIVHAYSSQHC